MNPINQNSKSSKKGSSKISLQTDSLIRSCVVDKKDLKLQRSIQSSHWKWWLGGDPNILKNLVNSGFDSKSKKIYIRPQKKNILFFFISKSATQHLLLQDVDPLVNGLGLRRRRRRRCSEAWSRGRRRCRRQRRHGRRRRRSTQRSEERIDLPRKICFKIKRVLVIFEAWGSCPEVFCCWLC